MPTVLAIGAHPDDIEFFMAGTLILLRDAGWTVHYMNLANGCCGSTNASSADTARQRASESIAAARLAGFEYHPSLVDDMDIFYDRQTLKRLAAVVREVCPQMILTHPPIDYMEDHTNTCRLVVSAAFTREMPNFITDPLRPTVSGPITIYHAQPHGNRDPLNAVVHPHTYVDITSALDLKTQMLACHESQQQWLETSQRMSAYLSEMQALVREVGGMSGRFEYAEGWRRHLHLGFCEANDDPLTHSLSRFVASSA